MFRNKTINVSKEKASTFMDFFKEKIEAGGNPSKDVFNGNRVIKDGKEIQNFSKEEIEKAYKCLKNKPSYGHDRVPMRVLKDSYLSTTETVTTLFNKIYKEERIPEIWRCSRVLPVHKKGPKNNIENYRPISNLCSIEKLYECCLLNKLLEISPEIDLTHENQYGFKKHHSTTLLGLQIQDRLSRSNKASIVSIDLSAAFDLVNHELLITRLRTQGLPSKLINLLKDWLAERYFYVECKTAVSKIEYMVKGTVQGSVLGPVLFSLFIRPMFEIHNILSYADDTYIITERENEKDLTTETERVTNELAKWLEQSGMKVNAGKTELMFLPKSDNVHRINVLGNEVMSKNEMKILGIHFTSNLTWEKQANEAILKVTRASNSMKHLAKYISQDKMIDLATAFGYSKLYYGAPIWLSPLLLKKKTMSRLLSASACLIKNALSLHEWQISFKDIHMIATRGTPANMSIYHQLVTVHNIWTTGVPRNLKNNIANAIYHNERHENFRIVPRIKTKKDYNVLTNRIISQISMNEFLKDTKSFKTHLKKTHL